MQGAGCRVQGAGFRVQGAGCRVQGAGCRVQGEDAHACSSMPFTTASSPPFPTIASAFCVFSTCTTPECWRGYVDSKAPILALSTFEIHCLESKLTFGDPFLDSGVVGGGVRIHPENARMIGRHEVHYVVQCAACAPPQSPPRSPYFRPGLGR